MAVSRSVVAYSKPTHLRDDRVLEEEKGEREPPVWIGVGAGGARGGAVEPSELDVVWDAAGDEKNEVFGRIC